MLAQVFDLFHVIALFFQMQLGIVKEQMQLVIFATADARQFQQGPDRTVSHTYALKQGADHSGFA